MIIDALVSFDYGSLDIYLRRANRSIRENNSKLLKSYTVG